jgi:prolyl-tRNA editing enzyme YbaK/EbsC (Cys-tRNA(Pro) deacylase)
VRKRLGARKVSFASVDARVMARPSVVVGGGSRSLKVRIAPIAFERLGAEIVPDLGMGAPPGG